VSAKTRKAKIREYFLLGLISILPVVLTFWVLLGVVGYLDAKIYDLIPGVDSPRDIFGVNIPGLGILLTLLLVLLAGVLAKTLTGKLANDILDSWLSKVPVVRGLYKATKQISGVFFSQEPSAFKKVVYVPFPYKGVRALAFVAHTRKDGTSFVFVPTSPNPTSGYILVYPTADLEDTPLSIEEAIQIVISGGALVPGIPQNPAGGRG
jgi:uncharacterized membrane protein